MIHPASLRFLSALKKNNNREWFEENRHLYLEARDNYTVFIQELINGLAKWNPGLKGLSAGDCLFRIYRDVRFSKNKDPYKVNLGAYICEGGRKSDKPGFYLQVQPGGESFAAGGCWMPQAPMLKAIRQEIKYHVPEFKKIIYQKKFREAFGELSAMKVKTAPRGVDKNDPDIDLYRYTSYVVVHPFTDKEVTGADFFKKNTEIYKIMLPFLDFLGRAVS